MTNSLSYYIQAGADTDDSDCDDILMQMPVFPSKKKPKQNGHSTDSLCLSQSSLESNSSTPSQQVVSQKPGLTEEQIETKAQQMIKDLQYPALGETNRMDQMGWHKAPKHKRANENVWYPCRLVTGDERIGLVKKSSNGGKLLIRYLGYQSDTAGQHGEIKEREYVPLSEENKEKGLEIYFRHLEKFFKGDGDLVRCRAEVLAVTEMWRKVEERETASLMAKDKASVKKVTTGQGAPSGAAKNEELKPPLADCGDSDAERSESDSDLENTQEYSASAKVSLRAGDVIEYYDPIGVVGRELWLKQTSIVGVAARAKFPLNLKNGDMLDRTVRVKLVKRKFRKKLENCHGAVFKSIDAYRLNSGGSMELVAMKAKAKRAKCIHNICHSQIEGFWKAK